MDEEEQKMTYYIWSVEENKWPASNMRWQVSEFIARGIGFQ
jgi:hypothetical protein